MTIDQNRARINAYSTSILLIATLLTSSIAGAGFLSLDFALRAFGFSKLSPLANLSKFIAKALNLPPKQTNAGPKVFAAQLGFLFSVIVLIGYMASLPLLSLSIGGAFLLCSSAEALFSFCVACKIYPFIGGGK